LKFFRIGLYVSDYVYLGEQIPEIGILNAKGKCKSPGKLVKTSF
jgi:hypothetical protein